MCSDQVTSGGPLLGLMSKGHCFPRSAAVQTRTGTRLMSELHVGDEVVACLSRTVSSIFLFIYSLSNVNAEIAEAIIIQLYELIACAH